MSLDHSIYALDNSISELANTIRREVYDNYGGWRDDVGRTYVYYSSSLENQASNLRYDVAKLNDVESFLNSINIDSEKNKVTSLINEVNFL